MDLNDADEDQDLDGEWTSELLNDPDGAGQEIEITAGGVVYVLSGDGLILYLDELGSDTLWTKDTSPTTSCGGETVE